MPQSTRTLTLKDARDLIRERSFVKQTGDRVGVELEWFTTPSEDPPCNADLEARLRPVLPLPCGSAVSFEPGAQVELSSLPLPTIADACDAVTTDAEVVRRELGRAGTHLFSTGLDPDRCLELRTGGARYIAMRRYFDRYGPAGGRMMCATASIHLNLDAGLDAEGHRRWRAAHLIGPTLAAAFANSPIVDAAPSGWKSSRLAAWNQLDPSRTRPVHLGGRAADEWARYALDAQVMFIRTGPHYEVSVEPLTLADWICDGHELGHPDADDVAYHLTTLFPPVRPRGYLELRMIDMVADPWWRVAVAVATALVCDPEARAGAEEACALTEGLWEIAARCGMEDDRIRTSAERCFEAAFPALHRIGCDGTTASRVHEYHERFVRTGRCPADDLLDRLEPAPIAEAR